MALRKFTSKEIGNNIRQIRVELDESQEEFGDKVGGFSQDAVAKWEAGQIPHALVLANIADRGRRSVDWILAREKGARKEETMEDALSRLNQDVARLHQLTKTRKGKKR